MWFGVDEENTVLRFLVDISNSNSYTLRGAAIEWVAYDKNDAIVGSYDGLLPDIPANGSVNYVGGAGSAHLSGTPTRAEVKILTDGLLTNRELPQISVSNVRLEDNRGGRVTLSADCISDSAINTVDLAGRFIVKDGEGQIIGADFWSAENLPDTIDANGKFTVSEYFFDLPAKPDDAEVYMYYIWE